MYPTVQLLLDTPGVRKSQSVKECHSKAKFSNSSLTDVDMKRRKWTGLHATSSTRQRRTAPTTNSADEVHADEVQADEVQADEVHADEAATERPQAAVNTGVDVIFIVTSLTKIRCTSATIHNHWNVAGAKFHLSKGMSLETVRTSSDTKGHQKTPKDTAGHRRTPKDTEGHRRTPKDTEGHRRTPRDTRRPDCFH